MVIWHLLFAPWADWVFLSHRGLSCDISRRILKTSVYIGNCAFLNARHLYDNVVSSAILYAFQWQKQKISDLDTQNVFLFPFDEYFFQWIIFSSWKVYHLSLDNSWARLKSNVGLDVVLENILEMTESNIFSFRWSHWIPESSLRVYC